MKLNSISIKQKVVAGITFAVLASTIIVGVMAQRQARTVLEDRLINLEVPATLTSISGQIDDEVRQLLAAAKQLADNEFIKQAIDTTTISPEAEARLIKQLNNMRAQYQLNDASVANRDTAYYWNQNGFLRQLNQQQDGWFFGFKQSGNATSVSIFQEANGDVKMFTNYQNLNGMSMSGLSKSMDDMVALLNGFQIEETGFVFLADGQGQVQIHRDSSKAKSTLSKLFGSNTSTLLDKSDFNLIDAVYEGRDVLVASSYIPSMNWFVVGVIPVDEVFSELNQVAKQMMITTIVVAGLFIIMGIFLANGIARPIRAIAERFADLGKGDGDLSQRIEIKGQDEIGQLSEGFNGFIEKIHQSMKEVASTSSALQSAADGVSSKSHTTYYIQQQPDSA
ncbi:Methyl-accepting chemotaxis protein McpH [Vibrio sp. NH-UV-68]